MPDDDRAWPCGKAAVGRCDRAKADVAQLASEARATEDHDVMGRFRPCCEPERGRARRRDDAVGLHRCPHREEARLVVGAVPA